VKHLLDTCAISALRRPKEHASLVQWISGIDEEDLYLSVVTIGELEKGVSRLPEGKKKDAVGEWIRHDVAARFGDRILPIDAAVAVCWGELLGAQERAGRALPVLDAFIAATALVNGCAIVTKNVKDFAECGVRLINP
jgi:predicted nucleic acid-binding protein